MIFIAEDHESVYDIVSCNLVIRSNYEFIQRVFSLKYWILAEGYTQSINKLKWKSYMINVSYFEHNAADNESNSD